jgi:hypothetical protein
MYRAGWAERLGGDLLDEGTQKLVPRYEECLNLHGDCVEKYFNVRSLQNVIIKIF